MALDRAGTNVPALVMYSATNTRKRSRVDDLSGGEFWPTLSDSRGTGSGHGAGKWEIYEHGRGAKKGKGLQLSGKPRGPKPALPSASTARQQRAVQRCLQERLRRDPELATRVGK